MGLKSKMAKSVQLTTAPGFNLRTPDVARYTDADKFRAAIKEQSDAIVMLDAGILTEIDADGNLLGTGNDDLHLSKAAFSDLCHFSKLPVSFIKRHARINEGISLDLIRSVLSHEFLDGQGKSLVIDSRNGRVEGIVGADTYQPMSNSDVLDATMSALKDFDISNGWLQGPDMEFTAIDKGNPVEPRPGDVIHFGTCCANSIGGDGSVTVIDYSERLVCTNGARAREGQTMQRIIHRGDVELNVQQAVLASATRAESVLPMMEFATKRLMMADEVRAFRGFIDEKVSTSTQESILKTAMREAVDEGRAEEEVTLWNMVNGVTEAAHDTASLQRRGELEALGYKSLVRFGALLAN